MKKLVFAFAFLCSTSLVAQFSFNANGSGIQTPYSTASGDFSTAMGASTTASGNYSTAMGSSSTASGGYSTAMGIATTASGDFSTAMGEYTTASGGYSTALGVETNASGVVSTAIGLRTKAQDFGTTAIGVHNETKETPNPETFSYQNTAFVIGNGGFDSNSSYDGHLSNAFEVLFDGSTTIAGNVTAPAFIGDGSQLTNLPTPSINYGDITNVPVSLNTNNTGVQTSYSNAFGENSTALGTNTLALGDFSTALGDSTRSGGKWSTAMGYSSYANGSNSIVIGTGVTADGNYSIAMGGTGTTASGDGSIAMGYNTTASGLSSAALCNNTISSGNNSVAMGYLTESSGNDSTATGLETIASGASSMSMGIGTVAAGDTSVSMGYYTTTNDVGTLAIGTYNLIDATPNPNTFSYANTAFVIGNGTDNDNRSNAFEVLFDGTTTIAGDLNINSDARLKANIISLGATLSKLLQIDGKTYTMKKDANHKKKIGLLAQDIEKVFPELVTETNDIKSVNYQGLVPVLINAMKEQDEVIRSQDSRLISQETKLNKQQQEIDELKAMVKALAKG